MKMNAYNKVVTMCAGLCILTLGGCASGPAVYDLRGQADPVLNRDVSGKSLSVVVRLYQLKQPTEFSKLAFDSLASGRPEAELLGAELIEKSEVVVLPGTQHVSTETLSEHASYLGVVAFFRQPEPHFWRYLIPASQIRSKGVTFRLQDCYITLVDGKPEAIPGQPLDAKPECNNTASATNLKVAPTASNPQPDAATAQPASDPRKPPKKASKTKRAYDIGKKVLDPLLASPAPMPNASAIKAPASTLQPSVTNINLQLPR
jgi:type VI secretion system protein VasD